MSAQYAVVLIKQCKIRQNQIEGKPSIGLTIEPLVDEYFAWVKEHVSDITYNGSLNFETAPVLSAFPEELKMDALRMIARIGEYFKQCMK